VDEVGSTWRPAEEVFNGDVEVHVYATGKIYDVVQFLLGNSPASVCYWPTFRNALSVPSS
jgi:hypothetical protein